VAHARRRLKGREDQRPARSAFEDNPEAVGPGRSGRQRERDDKRAETE